MNHYPWDEGNLHLLGVLTGQKTVKTFCEKRVSFANADASRHIDCPHCRAILEKRIQDSRAMLNDPNCTSYEGVTQMLKRSITQDTATLAK